MVWDQTLSLSIHTAEDPLTVMAYYFIDSIISWPDSDLKVHWQWFGSKSSAGPYIQLRSYLPLCHALIASTLGGGLWPQHTDHKTHW